MTPLQPNRVDFQNEMRFIDLCGRMGASDIHSDRTDECFDKIIRLAPNEVLDRKILELPRFIWFKGHCFERFFDINSQRKQIVGDVRIGRFDLLNIVLTGCAVAYVAIADLFIIRFGSSDIHVQHLCKSRVLPVWMERIP